MSSLKFYFNTARKLLHDKSNQFSRNIVSISIAGVALGIVVMIAAISITTGYKKVIYEKVASMGAHIRISNYDQNYSFEPIPFDKNQTFVQEIQQMPEIKSVQRFSTKSGVVKTSDQVEGIVLKGIDESFDKEHFRPNLIEGELLDLSDTLPSKEIIISNTLSKKLQLKLGDKVRTYFVQDPPMQRSFTIVGIFETGLPEYDSKFALVDLKQVQKLNLWDENQIGGMEILLHDFEHVEQARNNIDAKIGYQLKAESIQQIFPEIFQWIALFDTNVVVLLIITFCVCLVTIMSIFFIIVIEQTSTIGILKTLGMKTDAVVKLFLALAARILVRGLLWGNIIAFALCIAQKAGHFIKLDAATYYISYVPISFNIPLILAVNLAVLILCMLVLSLPAYLVARKSSPITAIKFD